MVWAANYMTAIQAITSTNSMNVKEQCLWALSNMSADGYGCDCLTAIPNILVPIMGFIGIVLSPSMVVDVTFPDRQMHSFSATHIAGFEDYPSLSVMRHVSMILGNFVRYSSPFPIILLLYIHTKFYFLGARLSMRVVW